MTSTRSTSFGDLVFADADGKIVPPVAAAVPPDRKAPAAAKGGHLHDKK